MSSQPLHIIGAGGHARAIAAAALAARMEVAGFLDDRIELHGTLLMGLPVLGPINRLTELHEPAGIIAIGSNRIREKFCLAYPQVRWTSVIHPFSWLAPDSNLGEGSIVGAGAIIQPGTTIGRHTIINTGATVDHDNCLGDFAQICPGVHLAGTIIICEGSFIGTGACVIPNLRIGAWSVVGAGACVVTDIPDGATAVGVPAKVIKMSDV